MRHFFPYFLTISLSCPNGENDKLLIMFRFDHMGLSGPVIEVSFINSTVAFVFTDMLCMYLQKYYLCPVFSSKPLWPVLQQINLSFVLHLQDILAIKQSMCHILLSSNNLLEEHYTYLKAFLESYHPELLSKQSDMPRSHKNKIW